jgi:cell division septum initiation protein DivIVA
MTPEQLLEDIENTEGPCLKMCAYCPSQSYLAEIKEVVLNLLTENKQLKQEIEEMRR